MKILMSVGYLGGELMRLCLVIKSSSSSAAVAMKDMEFQKKDGNSLV
jgi:hypothetical protein